MTEIQKKNRSDISDFLSFWLEKKVLDKNNQIIFDRYYKAYKRHFGGYIKNHFANQTREICTHIKSGKQRVLEVGAGCGTEALWFALLGAKVVSIDINEPRLNVAKARKRYLEKELTNNLDVEFRYQSLFDLEAQEQFDLIWMEQTFHHLEPREKVYDAIAGALAPGGHVIISETNGWNPLVQLQHLKIRGFDTIVTKTLADRTISQYGNERITVPKVIENAFHKVDITVLDKRYYRVLPNKSIADRIAFIDDYIPPFLRPLFCTHYNIIGRKKTP